jgi:hypothetical protein
MDDQTSRAYGMAAQTVLARLLHKLTEKGILSESDVSGLLTEATDSLASHHTDIASGAIGVVMTIAQAAIQSGSPKTSGG